MYISLRATLIALAAVAALAAAARWHVARVHTAEQAVHAHYAVVLAGIRDKTAAAEKAFRAAETEWQTRFDKEAQDGQDRIDAAHRDAAGARAAADSLRADLARYRTAARAAAHPSAATPGPPAGDALDLLADLFARADERAGELAAAADLAHAAGVTCQRAYDSLINPRRPDGGTTLSTSP